MRQGIGSLGTVHHLANTYRCLDIDPGMITPFHLVAVENVLGRSPFQDRHQFPGKIGRIANSRAHALAKKWRHQVRGITGNQSSALAPPCRQL